MATGFLILHGVDNVRPPEHWQSLLAAQLVEHGLEVRYPALPEPEAPDLERWLAALEPGTRRARGRATRRRMPLARMPALVPCRPARC
ncbi:MAG TPA: alpha/beta hydrolase [Solirubrobacterales bacterium]|nr:alpha/beta hydrolase [Solirubrobacterales bacterium]